MQRSVDGRDRSYQYLVLHNLRVQLNWTSATEDKKKTRKLNEKKTIKVNFLMRHPAEQMESPPISFSAILLDRPPAATAAAE